MASPAKSRKRTSMEASTPSEGVKVECRVCLQFVCYENQCCEMFDSWNQNPEATIASYFTQVTNIQVYPSDRYSKYICFKCLGLLQNCVLFIERAHNTQTKLQKRYEISIDVSSESLWPKPIQIDKCLSNNNQIAIEVKQEVLSEEEVPVTEMDKELRMEIKVEPEEYASYDCSPHIMDTVSINPIIEDESMDITDLNRYYEDEHYLEEHIKEEPLSDNESEVTPDLPLDCMLCTKTFNSVSGLKAHVIAQHSYLTIARKSEVRPQIYQCLTCRRTFATHTDLIVHETCHGQYACYMCNSKFETFVLLTKHRKRCRNNGNHVSRLKTLDDVKRPAPDPQNTKIADSTNKELESQKLNHSKEVDTTNSDPEPQKMIDVKAAHLTTTEPQTPHTSKTAESTNIELESHKLQHLTAGGLEPQLVNIKTGYSTEAKKKMEAQIIENIKAVVNLKGIESKAEESTKTESKAQKMEQAKLEDSVNFKTKLQKIDNLTNTESELYNNIPIINSLIQDDQQSTAIIEINNSQQDLNNPKSNNYITEDNDANSKVNNGNSEVNNDNSKVKNDNSKVINDNSEVNNANPEVNTSNSVLNNPKSEIDNPNCETTNKDLETETSKNDGCIEISTENKDFNQPDPETNVKKALSSDLSQRQSLNGKKANTTSPKVSGSAEVASRDVIVEFNSEPVSDSGDSAKTSNLDSDNAESVLEMNNTSQPLTERANSVVVSENSKENSSLVPESDSMKIHLAIHSLEKKSLDDLKEVKIDDEIIEATKSNEDKVLQ